MINKEQITKMKQEMPEFQGNDEIKKIKELLYIYLNVAKNKAFDEKYYYGSEETRKKMIALSKGKTKTNAKDGENKRITCITLTKELNEILKEFGYEAREEKLHVNDPHICSRVKLTKDVDFLMDLQSDLHKIQTKSKIKNFGMPGNRCYDLTDYQIEKLLLEQKYVDSKEAFRDEIIKELSNKLNKGSKIYTPEEKLKEILTNEKINEGTAQMECVEREKYYKEAIKEIMSFYDGRHVNFITCKTEKDNEVKYNNCIFIKRNENEGMHTYMYVKKAESFVPISIEKLAELQDQGLTIGIKENQGKKTIQKEIKKYKEKEKTKTKTSYNGNKKGFGQIGPYGNKGAYGTGYEGR